MVFKLYKYLVSPAIHLLVGSGTGCRFEPTCGTYAEQALKKKSVPKALFLIVRRIIQCHPWGKSGYDPVPEQIINAERV